MRYRFDEFTLDLEARDLRRSGTPVAVEPRVFALLEFLIAEVDRACSRQELLDSVWADAAVTASSLQRAVSLARSTLGPSGVRIETVRGFGYRFAGPVESVSDPAPNGGADDFVGRELELARLRDAAADAEAGSGRLLLCSGDPGVGKTRLVREFERRYAGRRFLSDWSLHPRGGSERALGTWSRALSRLRARVEPADWHHLDRELAPEVRAFIDGAAAFGAVSHSTLRARDRLRDQLADFILSVGAARPTLLILDDLQWMDLTSLEVLTDLQQRIDATRLLVVGTLRAPSALPTVTENGSALAALLSAAAACDRVALGPLSNSDTALLVRRICGRRTDAIRCAEIQRRCGGNPLFVREVSQLVGSEASNHSAARFSQLPPTVHTAANDRLARLPETTLHVLRVAATLGPHFDLSAVAHVFAAPIDAVARDLSPAESVGIVELEAASGKGSCITHDILREALIQGLSARDRALLHMRVARSLEEHYPGGATDDVVEALAEHWDAASLAGNVSEAIAARRRAATRATAHWSFERAVKHLERAMELATDESVPEGVRLECRLAYGLALLDAERFQEAKSFLESLAEDCVAADRPEIGARCVIALALRGIGNSGTDASHRLATGEALLQALPAAAAEAAPLRAAMSFDAYWGSPGRAEVLSLEAIEHARAKQSSRGVILALGARERFTHHPSRREEAERNAKEALALALAINDPIAEVHSRYALFSASIQAVDRPSVEHGLGRIRDVAARHPHPEIIRHLRDVEFGWRFALGDLPDPRQALESLIAEQARSRPPEEAALHTLCQLGYFASLEGRMGDLLPTIDQSLIEFELSPTLRSARALGLCQAGRLEEAREEVKRALGDPIMNDPHQWFHGLFLSTLTDVASRLEDESACEVLLDFAVAYTGAYLTVEGIVLFGCGERILGTLLRVLGRVDEAIDTLEHAAAIEREFGSGPPQAWALFELAASLERRGRGADLASAESVRHRAAAVERECGLSLEGVRR